VLFLFVVPSWYLGIERNAADFASWWQGMIAPFVVAGEVTSDHLNQSLPGVLFRLFTDSPSVFEKAVPQEYDYLVALDPFWIRWVVKGCMATFAGLVIWTCRTPTTPRRGWRLVAEFSIVVLGMLLFSERTWKHHCVTLLLPFSVICYYLAACRPGFKMRCY